VVSREGKENYSVIREIGDPLFRLKAIDMRSATFLRHRETPAAPKRSRALNKTMSDSGRASESSVKAAPAADPL
jgi:hypothetical protein